MNTRRPIPWTLALLLAGALPPGNSAAAAATAPAPRIQDGRIFATMGLWCSPRTPPLATKRRHDTIGSGDPR